MILQAWRALQTRTCVHAPGPRLPYRVGDVVGPEPACEDDIGQAARTRPVERLTFAGSRAIQKKCFHCKVAHHRRIPMRGDLERLPDTEIGWDLSGRFVPVQLNDIETGLVGDRRSVRVIDKYPDFQYIQARGNLRGSRRE